MSSTIKRIAVNSIFQYIELILNVVIGLASVRLILNALGVSDYGIYDLIGGIISLLGFITNSISQTSMRFLSVSLGEGHAERTRDTFSACLWLHLYIAILLSLGLISASFFLFNGTLNIPLERLNTAKIVYYLMVFNLFLSVSTTPFTSLLYSHERFILVSLIKVSDAVLKLFIAIIITYYSEDKLFLYALLMVGITMFDVCCYLLITYRYKSEISVKFASFHSIRRIAGFAGWTVLDCIGSVASRQGYAILLNSFFGTYVNAVFALSRQIEGHVYTVSASVINTMKPQILKSFGAREYERMFRLSMVAGKMGVIMMSIVVIPLIILMPDILTLWLKNVPEGTVLFSRLMVFACMFEQLTRGLVYANQAVGNIKWFSISISTIRVLALPISYCFFRLGFPAYVAIVVFLVCEAVGSLSRVFILSRISNFESKTFIRMLFFDILPPIIIAFAFCALLNHYTTGLVGMILTALISCIVYLFLVYLMGLTVNEKEAILRIAKSFMSKLS